LRGPFAEQEAVRALTSTDRESLEATLRCIMPAAFGAEDREMAPREEADMHSE